MSRTCSVAPATIIIIPLLLFYTPPAHLIYLSSFNHTTILIIKQSSDQSFHTGENQSLLNTILPRAVNPVVTFIKQLPRSFIKAEGEEEVSDENQGKLVLNYGNYGGVGYDKVGAADVIRNGRLSAIMSVINRRHRREISPVGNSRADKTAAAVATRSKIASSTLKLMNLVDKGHLLEYTHVVSSSESSPFHVGALNNVSDLVVENSTASASTPTNNSAFLPHNLQVRSEPGLIQCLCDTSDCLSVNEPTCRTSGAGSCYTQSLERPDGSVAVTRGCISGPTPLLCENRRPKMVQRWPFLKCCKTDMCNWDAASAARIQERLGRTVAQTNTTFADWTGPTTTKLEATGATSEADLNLQQHKSNSDLFYHNFSRTFQATYDQYLNETQNTKILKDKNLRKRFLSEQTMPVISPLAAAFLTSGAVLIIIISAAGFMILRKETRSAESGEFEPNESSRCEAMVCPYRSCVEVSPGNSLTIEGVSNPVLCLEDCPRNAQVDTISIQFSLETCLVHSALTDEDEELN